VGGCHINYLLNKTFLASIEHVWVEHTTPHIKRKSTFMIKRAW
jgi:hypothetical protein